MKYSEEYRNKFYGIGTTAFINYELRFSDLDLTIDNEDIISESIKISKSLCSESTLKFGGCIASCFSVTVAGINDVEIEGKQFSVVATISDENDTELTSYNVGTFYVDSSKISSDKMTRDIVAYDALYNKGSINVAEWYESMFDDYDAINLNTFVCSLLDYIGMPYKEDLSEIECPAAIKHGVSMVGSEVTAKSLLQMALELIGCFGYVTSTGKFDIVSISSDIDDTIDEYKDFSKSDYTLDAITGIQMQLSTTDNGVLTGTDTNVYKITSNYLTYGMTESEITALSNNLLEMVSNYYVLNPCSVTAYNLLYMQLGDVISVLSEDGTSLYTPVLNMEIDGIQASKVTLSCNLAQNYDVAEYSQANEVVSLKGKTLAITKTLDEVSSRMADIENNTSSAIVQTGNKISMNVKKGNDTVSIDLGDVDNNGNLILSATAKDIMLTADNIKIISDNFNVDEKGNVTVSGNDSMIRVRNNDFSIDLNSSEENLLSMYECPLIFTKSTLDVAKSFGNNGFGTNYCVLDGNVYTVYSNAIYVYDNTEEKWKKHQELNAKYNCAVITTFNNTLCVGGVDEVTDKSFVKIGENYVEIDDSSVYSMDIIEYDGSILFATSYGLYKVSSSGSYSKITENQLPKNGIKRFRQLGDTLYFLDCDEGVFKVSKKNGTIVINNLTLGGNIPDVAKIGSKYVCITQSGLRWTDSEFATFYECDTSDYEESSIPEFKCLVNTGDTILCIGSAGGALLIMETYDGINYKVVMHSPEYYDGMIPYYKGLLYNGYLFIPILKFNITVGSVTQEYENRNNILSVSKSNFECATDIVKFEQPKYYSDDDSEYESSVVLKHEELDPEHPEYNLTFTQNTNYEKLSNKLDHSHMTLEKEYDDNDTTSYKDEMLVDQTYIRFNHNDNNDNSNDCNSSLSNNKLELNDYYEDFNISSDLLKFKNEIYAHTQQLTAYDEEDTQLAKCEISPDGIRITGKNDSSDINIGNKEVNIFTSVGRNGYDVDEDMYSEKGGFKLYPRALSYAYGGLDTPYEYYSDIHMALYAYSNDTSKKPCIKVEQRNKNGLVNEAYLFNGNGDTSFPNKVSASSFSATGTISSNKFTAPYFEVTNDIKIGKTLQAYAGIDTPYENGTDIHSCIYAMSQSYSTKPCVKAEQRNMSGTVNEAFILDGNGDTRLPNNVYVQSAQVHSDSKLKENIVDLDEETSVKLINSLNPVEYNFKNSDKQRKHMGFIAQDTKELCTSINMGDMALYDAWVIDDEGNMISKYVEGTDDEHLRWHLGYNELIAPMVKTIQSLTKRVEELEKQLSDN